MEAARLVVKYLEGPECVGFAKIIGKVYKYLEIFQHNKK